MYTEKEWIGKINALKAERDRYRTALEEIVEIRQKELDKWPLWIYDDAQDVAKQALEGDEE